MRNDYLGKNYGGSALHSRGRLSFELIKLFQRSYKHVLDWYFAIKIVLTYCTMGKMTLKKASHNFEIKLFVKLRQQKIFCKIDWSYLCLATV